MTTMDKPARAWLVKVAAENYWRVAHWYDFDDLLQDGHMVWWRIIAHYETIPGRIRSRPHLMSLFKRSFIHHIHSLSKDTTVARREVLAEDIVSKPGEAHDDPWTQLGAKLDLGEYERLVAEAPKRVQELLRVLFDPAPSRTWRAQYRARTDGTRETTNERLCHLVGADPSKFNLADELFSYLRRT